MNAEEPLTGSFGIHLLEGSDWEWRRRGPTPAAIQAFGVSTDSLRQLPGGAGHTWTDGRLVLKPVGCAPEHDWVCEVYASWTSTDVRVPEPLAPRHGSDKAWSVEGWGAHVFVTGRDLDPAKDLTQIKEASDAFHQAVVHLDRPAWMNVRDDPWAYGDRLAWEGAEPQGDAVTLELIGRLRAGCRPVKQAEQVIHGDILPNVLSGAGRVPAVIDWPPYFRPVGMANAIALTDAVTFRGAPLQLLSEWGTGADWNQMLIRALLYRLGPTGIFAARHRLMGRLVTHLERIRPVVDAVLAQN